MSHAVICFPKRAKSRHHAEESSAMDEEPSPWQTVIPVRIPPPDAVTGPRHRVPSQGAVTGGRGRSAATATRTKGISSRTRRVSLTTWPSLRSFHATLLRHAVTAPGQTRIIEASRQNFASNSDLSKARDRDRADKTPIAGVRLAGYLRNGSRKRLLGHRRFSCQGAWMITDSSSQRLDTVVVVGNGSDDCSTIPAALRAGARRVLARPDVGGALQAVEEAQPQLVIIREGILVADALRFIRSAKDVSNQSAVVVVANRPCIEHAVKLVGAGAHDYVQGPLTHDSVVHLLESVCSAGPDADGSGRFFCDHCPPDVAIVGHS